MAYYCVAFALGSTVYRASCCLSISVCVHGEPCVHVFAPSDSNSSEIDSSKYLHLHEIKWNSENFRITSKLLSKPSTMARATHLHTACISAVGSALLLPLLLLMIMTMMMRDRGITPVALVCVFSCLQVICGENAGWSERVPVC